MVKNVIGKTLLKNRYLAISCLLLLFGTILGIIAMKSFSEDLYQKVYIVVTKSEDSFFDIIINRFVFLEILLFMAFLSGFSILGHLTGGMTAIILGVVYGIKNAVSYSVLGSDYVIHAIIEFFVFYIFFVFFFLLMLESSFQQTQILFLSTFAENDDRPHYNAKSQSVKFICFTVISLLFLALYAYLTVLIG